MGQRYLFSLKGSEAAVFIKAEAAERPGKKGH
jgi:hypothetical protein